MELLVGPLQTATLWSWTVLLLAGWRLTWLQLWLNHCAGSRYCLLLAAPFSCTTVDHLPPSLASSPVTSALCMSIHESFLALFLLPGSFIFNILCPVYPLSLLCTSKPSQLCLFVYINFLLPPSWSLPMKSYDNISSTSFCQFIRAGLATYLNPFCSCCYHL